MIRVRRDTMFKPLDKGGKNVPNVAFILMATFVCGCIKLCVDPQFANFKCHYVLRFYLSPVLQRMGLVILPRNAPSSWTVPYCLSFMEKFLWKNTFDHQSIRQWSARNILKALREKEMVDPVGWSPEQKSKVIWQNASSPELSNKHQDVAWLMVRRALPVRSFLHTRSLTPSTRGPRGGCGGKETLPTSFWNVSLQSRCGRDAVVFVEVHPKQLCSTGVCALWAVPRDAHRDKHQLLLEDYQFVERRSLVCPKLAGLPAQRVVHDRMLQTGTFQGPGLRAEGRTKTWGSRSKGSMWKDHSVRSPHQAELRSWIHGKPLEL